jgi:hypothetical protein
MDTNLHEYGEVNGQPSTWRRLSSKLTWWYKRGFPIYLFAFIALFTLFVILAGVNQPVPAPVYLFPAVMAVFGYVLLRWLVFPLADEVFLSDDQIIVRNGGEEDSFPITNIINVEASLMVNPERITLTLREPCRFGREVIFSPPVRWWPFTRHPLAEELIRRVNHLPPYE